MISYCAEKDILLSNILRSKDIPQTFCVRMILRLPFVRKKRYSLFISLCSTYILQSVEYVLRSKDILQLAIHRKAFSHSAFIRQPSFNILAFRGNAVRLFNKDGTFYKEHTFCAVLPFFEAISRSSRSVFLRYRIICNQAVQYSAIFCYMKVLCVQVRLATVAYLLVCRFILCVGTYEHVLRSDCFAVIYDCSCS